MKLKKLIKDFPIKEIKGSKEIEISGICAHSKLVSPGNLFIAKKGLTVDGSRFIPEAVAAGAAAILTDIYDPTLDGITQIIHPNPGQIEGLVASVYHHNPSENLFTVAITGTNGKTTTSFLLKHLLDKLKGPCGLIGTIEYSIGQNSHQATRTTPDVTINQKLLHEMVLHGCHSAVMEVTSHGLDQGRVDHIDFDCAVFTNLTQDHLDYHKTMDRYAQAKSKLFRLLDPIKKKKGITSIKSGIVNIDDSWSLKVTKGCQANILTYGIDQPADLQVTDLQFTDSGTNLVIAYQGNTHTLTIPLIGRYNVYNCLAAMGVFLSQGYAFKEVAKVAKSFPPIPGRLEPIPNELGLNIYVDFAHSDDALLNVLKCLTELKTARIITVFGCGGERDRLKRPKMAKVCEDLSDYTIVTSDNPRSEDPEFIISEIVKGFNGPDSFTIESDRKHAIEKAIDMATSDDIILIAGRGHESYQIFAHQTVEFDDRVVTEQICKQKKLSLQV